MQLIDGKATAAAIKAEIAEEVKKIVDAGGKRPHLAAILVGHDGGSETYVKNKVLACEACGFTSTLLRFEDDITEDFLLKQVEKLNNDADVDGFIVQLPLPRHISEQKIIEAIGKPNFVTADMVKEGAVIVDVGTTRVPDATRKSGFRLNGDVDFENVAPKCSFITPVPGGVGPMTICSLMKNTLSAGRKEFYK